ESSRVLHGAGDATTVGRLSADNHDSTHDAPRVRVNGERDHPNLGGPVLYREPPTCRRPRYLRLAGGPVARLRESQGSSPPTTAGLAVSARCPGIAQLHEINPVMRFEPRVLGDDDHALEQMRGRTKARPPVRPPAHRAIVAQPHHRRAARFVIAPPDRWRPDHE